MGYTDANKLKLCTNVVKLNHIGKQLENCSKPNMTRALQIWDIHQFQFCQMKLVKRVRASKAFKLNHNGLNMCSKDEQDLFFFILHLT